jgi:dolichol kinase
MWDQPIVSWSGIECGCFWWNIIKRGHSQVFLLAFHKVALLVVYYEDPGFGRYAVWYALHPEAGRFVCESMRPIPGNCRKEILRKGIHCSTGILMAVLYSFVRKDVLVFVHLFFLLAVWFVELLRLKGIIQVPFLRDTERMQVGSHAFFMLSTFISILLFDTRIAIASILMLTVGDPASGAAQRFNRDSLGSIGGSEAVFKPLGVMVIMFMVSCSVGYLFLGSLAIAAFGALGAALADGLRLKVRKVIIDDNLTIPLYAGFLMSLASMG